MGFGLGIAKTLLSRSFLSMATALKPTFFLFIFFSFFHCSGLLHAAEVSSKSESGVNFVSAIAIAVVAASILVVIFFKLNHS